MRILAVADVYDALTSARPYKGAWSHEDAMHSMIQESGSHFDPRLIEVLVERQDEVDEIRERLADTVDEIKGIYFGRAIGPG